MRRSGSMPRQETQDETNPEDDDKKPKRQMDSKVHKLG
jgi:hypothetical protein